MSKGQDLWHFDVIFLAQLAAAIDYIVLTAKVVFLSERGHPDRHRHTHTRTHTDTHEVTDATDHPTHGLLPYLARLQ